ncbi:MAG: alkaline phosphatase family protein [Rhodothermales bacterium]
MIKRTGVAILIVLFAMTLPAAAQSARQTENVVLISLDGMRWQEVFSGADPVLIRNDDFVSDTTHLKAAFWNDDVATRRRQLMPFFWEHIAVNGQLYGDRAAGSMVDVTNTMRFSYPGYNEILTGFADPRIDSNAKRPNHNTTVLEAAIRTPGLAGKVAAFGSWDVFPFIINEVRSGVPVNAGFEHAGGTRLTDRERFLNELQDQIPSPWSSVRLDAFTHHYALEYLQRERPRLLYIAYGETDDFAHDGAYDHYLHAAHRTDAFIRELYTWVQSDPGYRDKTTFIITTDHGRGTVPIGAWRSHGDDVRGAEQIWLAIFGPDTPGRAPETLKGQWFQNQVASTVAAFLGITYTNDPAPGAPVLEAMK